MRRVTVFLLSLVIPLSACSTQDQRGGDIRFAPPLFTDQSWMVSQKDTLSNGERICTVTAGGVEVTQRSHGRTATRQVAYFSSLSPGDSYKILVAGHYYQTPANWFGPEESDAIIRDFMVGEVVYTELQKYTIAFRGNHWRSLTNKIWLNGFAAQYQSCERFVMHAR